MLQPHTDERVNAIARIGFFYKNPGGLNREHGIMSCPPGQPALESGVPGVALDILSLAEWYGDYVEVYNANGGQHEPAIQAVEAMLRNSEEYHQQHPNPSPPSPSPFKPAPRFYRGNMCGVRVPGLPAIAGGANDPSLVLSWLYDRYNPEDRKRIRGVWKTQNYLDVLLSWPDSRAYGQTPQQFRETIDELLAEDFFPCPMLCSKDHDPHDVYGVKQNIEPILPYLIDVVPRICIGWELSLWLTPTQVQELIDWLAPMFTPAGTRVYVHFQEGYMAFQQPGQFIADFWKANVGLLTGVLAQKKLSHDNAQFRDWIGDCLTRMAGNFNMPTDSGFGHPFDFVMLEISAQPQFNGGLSEAEGDTLGQFALNSPPASGPAGIVRVQGSGNGSQF